MKKLKSCDDETDMREVTTQILERYLLGDLSDEERDQIAERYFLDGDFFEGQVVPIEDQLIRRYLGNELNARDRRLFEEKYLQTQALKAKVEEARRFQVAFAGVSPNWIPAKAALTSLRWRVLVPSATLALAGIVAFAAAWLMPRRLEPVSPTVVKSPNETSSKTHPVPIVSRAAVVVLPLLPGVTQGARPGSEAQRILLTGNEQEVRLNLDFPGEMRSLRVYVKVELVKDRTRVYVRSWDQVQSVPVGDGQTFVVSLRTSQLPTGQYIATVKKRSADSDEDAIDSYDFSVDRIQPLPQ